MNLGLYIHESIISVVNTKNLAASRVERNSAL